MIEECGLKLLTGDKLIEAAKVAVERNPSNAPNITPPEGVQAAALELEPQRIAALTTAYWGPKPLKLTVSFMERTASDLSDRILSHMNAWGKTTSIEFVKASSGKSGAIRITRNGGGYWSYLGTAILTIPKNEPTMSLEAFSMQTSEAEFTRVVRHETGHTLGFPHEHMRKEIVDRLDRAKCYEYFRRTSGWNRSTVDSQVFATLNEKSIMGTPPDRDSIMCYRFPGSITKDGKPINGGPDIDASDYAFAGKIYPKQTEEFDTI